MLSPSCIRAFTRTATHVVAVSDCSGLLANRRLCSGAFRPAQLAGETRELRCGWRAAGDSAEYLEEWCGGTCNFAVSKAGLAGLELPVLRAKPRAEEPKGLLEPLAPAAVAATKD